MIKRLNFIPEDDRENVQDLAAHLVIAALTGRHIEWPPTSEQINKAVDTAFIIYERVYGEATEVPSAENPPENVAPVATEVATPEPDATKDEPQHERVLTTDAAGEKFIPGEPEVPESITA